MRVFQLLTAAALSLTALAAKKTTRDPFDDFNAKQISNGAPLKLDDTSYAELTKAPRDFSVAVLLNAKDPRFACHLCVEFQPEWDLLARSWMKGDKKAESRLIFGNLEFLDGRTTFQSLGLQTAPVLLLFHPTTGPHAQLDQNMVRFDFSSGVSRAEPVHTWITRNLPNRPHPPVTRPINYLKIAFVITSILGAITFVTVAAPYALPVLQNRNLWAAGCLLAVLLFTSGHMFNYIRHTPYISGDGKGGINYFAGGFQNQFGLESQIVAAMYGVLAFATISLALKVPRIADPRTQQIAVFVWGGILFGMYSFLLSVFRVKNGGYPFYLPPF